MSTVDEMRRSIEEYLDQVEENADWIEKHGPAIIDSLANSYLLSFPSMWPTVRVIAARAKAELAKAVRHTRIIVALVRVEIQYMGSPDALREVADTIQDKIIVPARALAHGLVLGNIPSALPSNFSDGIASESYRAAIDGRDSAVRDIETYSSPVVDALNDHATAIEDYYRALRDIMIALLGLIVSIVTAIVGWSTIVLGVLGIIGAVGSVLAIVAMVTDLADSTKTTVEASKSAFSSDIPKWSAVLT